MSDSPYIPPDLRIYNSYVEDPKWQRNFTYAWLSALAVVVLVSLPISRRALNLRMTPIFGMLGIWEVPFGRHYAKITGDRPPLSTSENKINRFAIIINSMASAALFTLPGFSLNLGQTLVILAYLGLLLVCMTTNVPLMDNPNRAGFMAIAQLPVIFLFSTKNSVLFFLLGPGSSYEKVNYVHRWSGRFMFLSAAVHGSIWLFVRVRDGLPILGQQKEGSGIAAFVLLCAIVLSSLRPVRNWYYQVFRFLHIFLTISFFITMCSHTIYAYPWIIPPLAFYGLDILLRLLRYRIRDASLESISNQCVMIRVKDCAGGWVAGQHVRLKVFFDGRLFESHPLSIISAPASSSCLTSPELLLAARVNGDWTRALAAYATKEQNGFTAKTSGCDGEVVVPVMLDGPYGGCSIDIGRYESVLLIAGGSGVTFTLGLLDDIIGRCIKAGRSGGERVRKIEFAWCTRSFGSILWFASMLMDIATMAAASSIDLHICIFVTCLCVPEALPSIPNLEVTLQRPSVTQLLLDLLASDAYSPSYDVEDAVSKHRSSVADASSNAEHKSSPSNGGVAVCASGPDSLMREVQNAVAKLSLRRGRGARSIALHTESFCL